MTVKRVCPYPVGEIRMSVSATDPATIWPNTSWEQINGKFLMSCDADHAAGTTGGSATHAHTTGNCTLTVDQIPSHTHEQESHNHTQNAHTHTQNAHTHTQNAHAHTVNGGAGTNNITGGGHAHNVGKSNNNAHAIYDSSTEAAGYGLAYNGNGFNGRPIVQVGKQESASRYIAVSTTHTHSLPAHTHTCANTTATNQNTTATNQNTTATNNAATAVNKSTGGGKAHSHGDTGTASNLPPYLAVYMWKRVA